MVRNYTKERWLRKKYWDEGKSSNKISELERVSDTTISNWMDKHDIEKQSSIMNPEHTTHIVRSEWE